MLETIISVDALEKRFIILFEGNLL